MSQELAVPAATAESSGDDPAETDATEPAGAAATALAFGRALGGDPTTVSDLPFTERADDGLTEELYVRHDAAMLGQVSNWLVDGQHISLRSGPGTGKSALRAVIERDLRRRWDFAVAAVDTPGETTDRGLCESVLRAAGRAGYAVDPDDYWQIDDGVPWLTEEVGTALRDVLAQMAGDEARPLLLVDGVDRLDSGLAETLTELATAGVQLCLFGREDPAGICAAVASELDDPLRTYEGIEQFDQRDVAEYVARSLARFRDEEYDSTPAGLFSGDAIEYIHETTGGTPRDVRETCFALFVRAAAVWEQLEIDIDRVTITSALADRDIDRADVPSV